MLEFQQHMMEKALGPIKAEMDAILALPESAFTDRRSIPENLRSRLRELSRQKVIVSIKEECSLNLYQKSKNEGNAEEAMQHFDDHKIFGEQRKRIHDDLWSMLYKKCELDPNKVWSFDESEMYVELDKKSTIGKYVERRLFQEAAK